jgi:uncharacterized protein
MVGGLQSADRHGLTSGRSRLYLNMARLVGMRVLHVRPPGRETVAAFVAERYLDRLLGLIGVRSLPPATGLLIPRCRAVHTFGMRFALDILFVTCTGASVCVHDERRAVSPGRLVRASRHARRISGLGVLELPAC